MERTIFEIVAAFAAELRSIDPRITYAPISLHAGGAHVAFQVESDDAVRAIAAKLNGVPIEPRNHDGIEWIVARLSQGRIELSFGGPHRAIETHPVADQEVSRG